MQAETTFYFVVWCSRVRLVLNRRIVKITAVQQRFSDSSDSPTSVSRLYDSCDFTTPVQRISWNSTIRFFRLYESPIIRFLRFYDSCYDSCDFTTPVQRISDYAILPIVRISDYTILQILRLLFNESLILPIVRFFLFSDFCFTILRFFPIIRFFRFLRLCFTILRQSLFTITRVFIYVTSISIMSTGILTPNT